VAKKGIQVSTITEDNVEEQPLLVTGATSGIAGALALRLAKDMGAGSR
jgi:NAD(P)-dependent dehydrogenase (short-subunit alcohol dehydrogenase family)